MPKPKPANLPSKINGICSSLLIFTVPLFILHMLHSFQLLPSAVMTAPWLEWLFCACNTRTIRCRLEFYINGYKALKNGAANMDLLVAMGSTTAYIYSILIMLGIFPGHGYFESAAVIITLVRMGKYLKHALKAMPAMPSVNCSTYARKPLLFCAMALRHKLKSMK